MTNVCPFIGETLHSKIASLAIVILRAQKAFSAIQSQVSVSANLTTLVFVAIDVRPVSVV